SSSSVPPGPELTDTPATSFVLLPAPPRHLHSRPAPRARTGRAAAPAPAARATAGREG
ncbi:unnamed protein product, partial [Bubo scandiacus]